MSNEQTSSELAFTSAHPSGNFTITQNFLIRDNKYQLPGLEYALLLNLLSHKPGWHVYTESIMKLLGVGRDKAKATMRGLKEKGFVKRTAKKDATGLFCGWETVVSAEPEFLFDGPPENQSIGPAGGDNKTNINNTACRQPGSPPQSKTSLYKKKQSQKQPDVVRTSEGLPPRAADAHGDLPRENIQCSATAAEIAAIGNAIDSDYVPTMKEKAEQSHKVNMRGLYTKMRDYRLAGEELFGSNAEIPKSRYKGLTDEELNLYLKDERLKRMPAASAEPSAPAASAAFIKNDYEIGNSENSPAEPLTRKRGLEDKFCQRVRMSNVISGKEPARSIKEVMQGLIKQGKLKDGKDQG